MRMSGKRWKSPSFFHSFTHSFIHSFQKLLPVFITLDPARDSPAIVKKYCEEFSPKMLGYVGSLDETKETTSNFKIYFG